MPSSPRVVAAHRDYPFGTQLHRDQRPASARRDATHGSYNHSQRDVSAKKSVRAVMSIETAQFVVGVFVVSLNTCPSWGNGATTIPVLSSSPRWFQTTGPREQKRTFASPPAARARRWSSVYARPGNGRGTHLSPGS